MSGMNQSAVRRVNTSVVLRALAVSAGPTTLTALAERAGLSRRTIELILDSLVEAGWVAELERIPTSGSAGRPARRYELRAEHALLAAVYINTADASAVIADVRGRIVGRAHRPLRAYQDPQATLDDAAALVREALDDAGGSPDRLRAGAVAGGRWRHRRRGGRTTPGAHHALGRRASAEGARTAHPDALVRGQRLQPRCAGGALAGCGR
jgi:DNA-binding transcriptional ArsR family regulator